MEEREREKDTKVGRETGVGERERTTEKDRKRGMVGERKIGRETGVEGGRGRERERERERER